VPSLSRELPGARVGSTRESSTATAALLRCAATAQRIGHGEGNLFTGQFPKLGRACERLPPDMLLHREIVAVDETGRISFNLLQHHRSNKRTVNALQARFCASR
jgi:hypothetical protein